ncbi:hypothetical protein ACSS6W_009817 [Trichoderma asperelloides]
MTQLGEEHRPAGKRVHVPTNVRMGRWERREDGFPIIWIVMRDERSSGDSHVMMRCRCLAHCRSVELKEWIQQHTCMYIRACVQYRHRF